MEIEKITLLGVNVHKITRAGTIESIEKFINEKTPKLIVTLGTEMIMAARKNKEFMDVLNAADIGCADAVGIVWASRIIGNPLSEKVAGIDLVVELARLSELKGWKLFFLGAAEGVAKEAASRLKGQYPGMQIAGCHHGYFKDEEEIIEIIRKASPDILLVALGSPRQELFFHKNRDNLGVAVGIGVGGSFDVLSGRLKRSPRWMIGLGLEWLYRLYLQPWRWKRMLVLPLFAMNVLFSEKCSRKRSIML